MKVSAFIAAALLIVSVSAQADHHENKKGAAKAKTTTTTTTTEHSHDADHKDCSKLKGTEKTTCEAHEKTAHAQGEATHGSH